MSEENNLQVSKQSDEQFCSSCGKPIKIKAEICPHCGVRQSGSKEKSEKNWMTCLLLCIFFGWLGIHRFYAGKIISGIIIALIPVATVVTIFLLLPFSAPLTSLIVLIDLIMIVTGNFKDGNNKYIIKD